MQNVDLDYTQFYDSPVARLNNLGLKEQNRLIHDFWSQYVFLLRLRLPLTLSNVALGADSRPSQPLPRWLNILYVYEILSIRYQSDHLSQYRFKLYIHPIRPTFSSQIPRFHTSRPPNYPHLNNSSTTYSTHSRLHLHIPDSFTQNFAVWM